MEDTSKAAPAEPPMAASDRPSLEEFIESFVEEHFRKASPEDKHSLQGSALMFIAEKEDFTPDEASLKELRAKLARDLKGDFGAENWREVSVEGMRRTTEYDFTGEDVIDVLAKSAGPDAGRELSSELEEAATIFEQNREALREFLPPILFEAFMRFLEVETQAHLTAGFSDESLRVLCWRAVARIRSIQTS